MDTVTVRDLRNHSAQVLRRVENGHSLEITRDGEPVAQVVPLPRARLDAESLVERWSALPRPDAEAWRRDVDGMVDPSL